MPNLNVGFLCVVAAILGVPVVHAANTICGTFYADPGQVGETWYVWPPIWGNGSMGWVCDNMEELLSQAQDMQQNHNYDYACVTYDVANKISQPTKNCSYCSHLITNCRNLNNYLCSNQNYFDSDQNKCVPCPYDRYPGEMRADDVGLEKSRCYKAAGTYTDETGTYDLVDKCYWSE